MLQSPIPGLSLAVLGVVVALLAMACSSRSGAASGRPATTHRWVPAPASPPLGNPQVGLVPFRGQGHPAIPHGLEFDAVPLAELAPAPDRFDWGPLEARLDDVARRGHQLLLRVVLDSPTGQSVTETGGASALPRWLEQQGVRVTDYRVGDLSGRSPDYEHPQLRQLLTQFVVALGRRYDGDPRLGQITAGLLGAWGEWHTWPHPELFASKDVQREVLDAFAAAFSKTPVLLRRPVAAGDPDYVPTAGYSFGYHDDSFAHATLPTGGAADAWSFVPMLDRAGESARWQSAPIGGEVLPELQRALFGGEPSLPEGSQPFEECLERTRASWLIAQHAFGLRRPLEPEIARLVARMGYVLRVEEVVVQQVSGRGGAQRVRVRVRNLGRAPCLFDWPVEMAAGSLDDPIRMTGALRGLQPGAGAERWFEACLDGEIARQRLPLYLRVVSPLSAGLPVRFANARQDSDYDGWLSLAPRG